VTQPALARQDGDDRYYDVPALGLRDLPSITTILKGGVPKNLTAWATSKTAEYAVANKDAWLTLPTEEAIKLIKGEPTRLREDAGARGDAIHAYLEAKADGKIAPVPEQWAAWRAAADQFWLDWAPDVLFNEATVISETHGYAGTTDLIVRNFGDLGTTLLDYKAGNGIYDEVQLQTEAAANADYIVDADGVKHELPHIDSIACVHITPGGAVVRTYERGSFGVFLAARDIFLWSKAVRKMHRTIQPPKRLNGDTAALERITARAKALIDAGHGAALSAAWPSGVPTPRQASESGYEHTATEIAAMLRALRDAEQVLLAPKADIAEMILRLEALPPDLAAAVSAEAVRGGTPVPNLRTGRATSAQLVEVDRLVTLAEREQAERFGPLAQHVDASGLDPALVVRLVTNRPNASIRRLQELEIERAIAICSAVADTYLTISEQGEIAVTIQDTEEVVRLVGGKRAVLDRARDITSRHGLEMPGRSAADVLADPLLLAMVAAS
jgi:hypothetical protein